MILNWKKKSISYNLKGKSIHFQTEKLESRNILILFEPRQKNSVKLYSVADDAKP